MMCVEAQNRIHAYMDGEMELLGALAVEAHLLVCNPCRQMHAQHAAARKILRGHATCFAAPPALRARLRSLTVPIDRRAARPWRSWLPAPAGMLPPFGPALAFVVVATWTVSTNFAFQTAAV